MNRLLKINMVAKLSGSEYSNGLVIKDIIRKYNTSNSDENCGIINMYRCNCDCYNSSVCSCVDKCECKCYDYTDDYTNEDQNIYKFYYHCKKNKKQIKEISEKRYNKNKEQV